MRYHVQESTLIRADKTEVSKQLFDLEQWHIWSPWRCLEPEAQMHNDRPGSDPADYLEWKGNVIGEGSLQVAERDATTLRGKLEILKPFPSRGTVTLSIRATAEGTAVTWEYASSLPWYLFFLKRTVRAMVGRDYKRGLHRLKQLCETGKIAAELIFDEETSQREAFYFVGILGRCNEAEMGERIGTDFQKVVQALEPFAADAMHLTLYHKADPVGNAYRYSTGLAFLRKPEIDDETWPVTYYPKHAVVRTRLNGGYGFLADAWSGAVMRFKAAGRKPNNRVPSYEIYLKDPTNTQDPDSFKTDICLPVRPSL